MKWVLTLIAFILVGVMLAGIILGWFERDETPVEEDQTAVMDGYGNAMDTETLYRTYTFDVVLSNLFDDVQSELSVEVSGAGALYFGNGSYNDGGYLNYTNVVQRDLSELADKFITSAELSGTTLTVKTGSQVVENYYSSWGPDEDYVTEIFYDRYVVEVRDDTMGFKTADDTFNNQNAKYNAQNIGSCYFYVTVKDNVSGLSETVRLWLVSSVNGIALSAKTMGF